MSLPGNFPALKSWGAYDAQSWFLLFLVPFLLAPGFSIATSAQESSNSSSNQIESVPAIRTETNLIVVRVIVRDSQGESISGLSKRDFELLDNKRPQPISYFFEEIPPAAGLADAKSPEKPAGGLPARIPTPAKMESSSFVALFFDDYHMGIGNLGQIRDAAKRFVNERLDSGARVALYSTSGRLHLGFTNDRDKLEQTLSQLQFDLHSQPAAECPPMTDYEALGVTKVISSGASSPAPPEEPYSTNPFGNHSGQSSSQPPPPPGDTDPLSISIAVGQALRCSPEDIGGRASLIAAQNNQDARTTLSVLDALVGKISETPGGKRSITMVSEGFLDITLKQQMNFLIDRALRAKIIINTLDAQGLYTPAGSEIDTALEKLDPTGKMSRAYENLQIDSVNTDGDILAQAAEGTGGIFIKNNNDFVGSLKKMVGTYTTYVLGFDPPKLKLDGQFHTLSVKLAIPAQLTVQARRGYFAPKQSDAIAAAAAAGNQEAERALFSDDNLNGLPIQLTTRLAKVDSQTTKVSVTVDTDMRLVRFRREGGHNSDDLTLMVALFDPDGNFVVGNNQIVKLRLSDAGLRQAISQGGEMSADLNVKPGFYVVRAVLHESASQQLGTASQSLQVP